MERFYEVFLNRIFSNPKKIRISMDLGGVASERYGWLARQRAIYYLESTTEGEENWGGIVALSVQSER